MILAEFKDADAAILSAQLCWASGVRLICSLRSAPGILVESFVRSSEKHQTVAGFQLFSRCIQKRTTIRPSDTSTFAIFFGPLIFFFKSPIGHMLFPHVPSVTPACGIFPFASMLLTRREMDCWHFHQNAGALVCRMVPGVGRVCPFHQSQQLHSACQPQQIAVAPLSLPEIL